MTVDEGLANRNAAHEAEERAIQHLAKSRNAFHMWPDLIARLGEPIPIEERIRQRRAKRAAFKRATDEAWARLCREAAERGVPLEPPSWS
jgi:hypothetical protein